jgi:hypothetical protein
LNQQNRAQTTLLSPTISKNTESAKMGSSLSAIAIAEEMEHQHGPAAQAGQVVIITGANSGIGLWNSETHGYSQTQNIRGCKKPCKMPSSY